MSSKNDDLKSPSLSSEVSDLKSEPDVKMETTSQNTPRASDRLNGLRVSSNGFGSPRKAARSSNVDSPTRTSTPHSPAVKLENEDIIGGDITVKQEPGQPPKLSRSSTKKMPSRPPPIFSDLEDSTQDALKSFEPLSACIYANKYLGTTEHALECDCSEDWDATTGSNHACGEDSDCINRATKMECVSDCSCGSACQNRRFQRRKYANVSVIKTDKKGYGLRTDSELRPHDFIFEYIGEVIGEGAFRRRMQLYDQEGQRHFYFMSLTKGEFVDATKKGNLGRFCNHSCNPNCYVDKWVVGDKLRMGIFAERTIAPGEELVFNYNVDRYGANPQPCYCTEPNCTGFIGGKTQTERATKLSAATIEALGIEDGEDWDIAVAKKGRSKKKTAEDDEEYVDSVRPKSLDESAVTKVMATLMQCKEKWIAVKLLSRIQEAEEDKVWNRVVKMHGYQILKTALTNFLGDNNVELQVLDILHRLPRLTRNKIQDSKIEDTLQKLLISQDERVKERAEDILKIWAALEVGYRIPRQKGGVVISVFLEREEQRRRQEPSRSRSSSPPTKPSGAPTGPRAGLAQRLANRPPPFRRAPPTQLPPGWFVAHANGKTYFYSASGQTTWTRPIVAAAAPPPPPQQVSHEQELQKIIEEITKKGGTSTPKDRPSGIATLQIPESTTEVRRVEGNEKWRSYDEDKRKKIYENTLFPHIKYVMDKFKGKLPKDDLKRFAKEVAKSLVASDFKKNRVEDPTSITTKQERQVKDYVKKYFQKAVDKKRTHDATKAARPSKPQSSTAPAIVSTTPTTTPPSISFIPRVEDVNSIEEDDPPTESDSPPSTDDLKRKRLSSDDVPTPLTGISPGPGPFDAPLSPVLKRLKSELEPPPPPPPPPPAEEDNDEDVEMDVASESDAEVDGVVDVEDAHGLGVRVAVLQSS